MYHSMKESPYLFKKIKNKKGFTLIELLAVIVVLAIVLIIAVPAIGRVIENSKQQAYLDDEKMMEKATRTYVTKNPNVLPREIGEIETIELTTLVNSNYISEIRDPKNKSLVCTGYVEVEKINENKYTYDAYLQCGDNYATEGIIIIEEVTDSNPGTLSGIGSEGNPYLIESIEDLVAFGQSVDSGTTYEGLYIKLNVNLDFDNDNSYVNPNTTVFNDINGNGSTEGLKTELSTGKGFNPIGYYQWNSTNYYFRGIFDGNNKTIKKLYINSHNGNNALFAASEGATLKNLDLIDIDITKEIGNTASGLSGEFYNGEINNVYVTGKITGGDFTSGIAGWVEDSTIINCVNYADISTIENNSDIGGILGGVDSSVISNNINYGNVIGGLSVGGVVGYVESSNVINNSSYGTFVEGSYDSVGGIIGILYSQDTNHQVYNNYCTSNVTGSINVGGIIGEVRGSSSYILTISNNYTTGDINGHDSSSYQIGGLIGFAMYGTIIENNYVVGNVEGYGTTIGGVIGYAKSSVIRNNYVLGNVFGNSNIGGLIGYSDNNTINNNFMVGNTTGNNYAGLIIGQNLNGVSVLTNNHYYENAICTGCDNTIGTAVTGANLGLSSWYTGTLGWSSQWSFTNGKYPLIKKDATTLLEGQTLISTP